MNHKRTKKRDEAGLYIAIVCCILVIALIGYVNSEREENDIKDVCEEYYKNDKEKRMCSFRSTSVF